MKDYDITLDSIINKDTFLNITLSQGDMSSGVFNVAIKQRGNAFPLAGKKVYIVMVKPDKTVVFDELEVVDPDGGRAKLTLDSQVYTASGAVQAELFVMNGKNREVTNRFTFRVRDTFIDDLETSVDAFRPLDKLFEAIDSMGSIDFEELKELDFNTLVRDEDLGEYAKKEEIPDVSEFITKEDIPEVDLTNYAKKEEIPDTSNFVETGTLEDYAKHEDVKKVSETSKENSTQIEILSENINSKQDWNKVYSSLKVANDNNLVIKKTDSNNLEVYINHFGSRYQKWNYSRTNGFDNAVTSHANGNVWQIDQVRNVVLGNTVQKDINSVTLTKTGTWTPSSTDKIYSANTGDYIEETVFGTEITLDYLALNSNGIAEIKVDGVVVMNVDMYDVSAGTNRKVVIASGLSNKNHTVRITVAGTKNAASSGTKVWYRYLITNSKVNFDDLSVLVETAENLPSGTNIFRYGQSAIEIALLTNINGNSKWAGTYHKYFRPAVADNQKIYIDGVLKPLANLVAGSFYATKDVLITQDLLLMNVDTDIAKVQLAHHFTAEGCHVKWILEWIAQPLVERSYNAMFGTSVDRVILGDTQTPIIAIKDSGEKGNSKTDNMIGWHTTDEYIVTLKGLNTPKMTSNYTKNMYAADRTTDFKLYYPKLFNVTPKIGEKWMSEFKVGIAKALNVNNMVV
ncbi:hypothetical protein COI97_16115 [Bacillus cereus]|nr:hypothetical protein COI97_16115 [Bacillus cereus]